MSTTMSPRRRELLAIAAGLFAEHGYDNVTIDAIGAAAGCSNILVTRGASADGAVLVGDNEAHCCNSADVRCDGSPRHCCHSLCAVWIGGPGPQHVGISTSSFY